MGRFPHPGQHVPQGRADIPDLLLFADTNAKAKAQAAGSAANFYRHGLAIVENKAWQRPLDRRSRGVEDAPDGVSTQILRYLSLAEVQSDRRIQWSILTNGRHWRLYWQGVWSRSVGFLEINVGALLDVPGQDRDLFAPASENTGHWLKVFALLFGKASFLPCLDGLTFRLKAIDAGRRWEEKVRQDLYQAVLRSGQTIRG